MKQKTDYRFKILYAAAMVMVVCGHCEGGSISLFFEWFPFRGLHLAIFAFCSGYFYKKEKEADIVNYSLEKAKRLLVPMYLFNIMYGLLVWLLSFKNFTIGKGFTLRNLTIAPIVNGHQFLYNMGGWFVVPLFMVEIFNICVRKLFGRLPYRISEYVYFLLYLSAGIWGVWMASNGYHNGWWLVLVRALYFLPFFGLGILYHYELEQYIRSVSSTNYFLTVFFCKFIIYIICGTMPGYTVSWCNNFDDGPLIPFAAGILGIAFWMRIADLLEPVMGRSRAVNLIADHTYSIMLHQFLGFMLVKTAFGLLSKATPWFSDFDLVAYRTDIWYYYLPNGMSYFRVLYLTAGLGFPILAAILANRIKEAKLRKVNTP